MSGLTILPRLCLHLDLPGLGLGGGLRRRRGREGLLGIRRLQDLNVELPHLKDGRKEDQSSLTLPPRRPSIY